MVGWQVSENQAKLLQIIKEFYSKFFSVASGADVQSEKLKRMEAEKKLDSAQRENVKQSSFIKKQEKLIASLTSQLKDVEVKSTKELSRIKTAFDSEQTKLYSTIKQLQQTQGASKSKSGTIVPALDLSRLKNDATEEDQHQDSLSQMLAQINDKPSYKFDQLMDPESSFQYEESETFDEETDLLKRKNDIKLMLSNMNPLDKSRDQIAMSDIESSLSVAESAPKHPQIPKLDFSKLKNYQAPIKKEDKKMIDALKKPAFKLNMAAVKQQ